MSNQLGTVDICAAWWRWESGELTTDSRNNFTLTAIGAPTADTDVKREGISSVILNGNQGFAITVDTTSTLPIRPGALSSKFGFSLWCRPAGYITSTRTILVYRTDSGDALHLYHDTTGLGIEWNKDHGLQESWQTGWRLAPQTWGHLSLMYDTLRRHLALYLYIPHRNALLCQHFLPRQELMLANGNLYIGYHPAGNGWVGHLDEAICWKQPVDANTLIQICCGIYGTEAYVQLYTGDLTYKGFAWNRTFWQ